MTSQKYILIGAKRPKNALRHFGGVLTLSISLVDYAENQGYDVEVIDTLRSGFDHIPILQRIISGLGRAFKLFNLLHRTNCSGVIIFAGAGFSFYERILLSSICRCFRVNDLFVIVDGWFFNIQSASSLKQRWVGFLLKIPHKLAASGGRWYSLYRELGINSNRIVSVHYWLPKSFLISEHPKTMCSRRPLRFLFVGWMINEKGIYELLAAIDALRQTYEFSFTFVGGGTLLATVQQKIRDFGWEKSISALGWVPAEEFQQIVAWADVFILPSYAEGFPLSLIEAMAKGLPAICTDVGGISDSLRTGINGYLIPPRKLQPLIDAMERYLRNPELIAEHSRASLEIVRINHEANSNCKLFFDVLR